MIFFLDKPKKTPSFLKHKTIPTNIIITGIICLTLLEIVALFNGINGLLFTIIVSVIALAIGVSMPTPKFRM